MSTAVKVLRGGLNEEMLGRVLAMSMGESEFASEVKKCDFLGQ